jgi:hypothetical protein
MEYADLASPLYQILKESALYWMAWQENNIPPVKKSPYDSSSLGIPVLHKFQLYVYEKEGRALGVLTKLQGISP